MSGHHHHDHGDGGHCHAEHDHSNDITPAIQSLLYTQIEFDKINTLNGARFLVGFTQLSPLAFYYMSLTYISLESAPNVGVAIVKKTWAERLNDSPELESDADEQLLIHIPYDTLLY